MVECSELEEGVRELETIAKDTMQLYVPFQPGGASDAIE
jgi:hypothetical protein